MNEKAVIRLRIAYSILTLLIGLVLATWFVVSSGGANPAAGGVIDPAAWPRAMLLGIAFCGALLVARNVLQYLHAQPANSAVAPSADQQFDNRRAAIGFGLLILYVVAIPVIGFALATVAFFLARLPFGSVRKLYVVASIAIVGTIVLLYVFVKLTTLPLERGIGVFGSATIALYRALGIY